MYQGTNPTLILPVEKVDLTNQTVQVAFRDATGNITIRSTPDIDIVYEDGTSFIFIPFSQEQTLQMPAGVCQIEVRSINTQGLATISYIASMDVIGSMTKNVISYQGGNADE